jgi:hypothetical protein
VWSVTWVARTLVADPRGLYDTNIFYPHKNTLAYSEPNLVTGVLAMPAYWASGGNPYLAHNSVLFLSFVLAFLGTYALVRHLTGSVMAGRVAGVSFAFCPYIFSHIPHIQLMMSAGLPFSLLAMHRLVDRPSAGKAVTLGVVVALQALACGYYGVFAALLVVPGIVFYGVRRGQWRRWQYWTSAAAAGLLAVALVLPFFLPYIELHQGAGAARTVDDARQWSANWASYLAAAAWAHRWLVPYLPRWGEVLFPGTIAVVFGGLGAVLTWKGRAWPAGRDHFWFYGGIVVSMTWASLGPDAGLYYLLHQWIPVFAWLRAPSRLGVLVVLALSVLAGFAVSWLLGRVKKPAVVGAVLLTLTATDLAVAPLFMVDAPVLPSAYEALKQLPAGPIAEFPFWHRRGDFHRHAEYMLFSTFHWRPLVNGYSDYFPPDFRQIVTPLSNFPDSESLSILTSYGVDYVIFHIDLYSLPARAELEKRLKTFERHLRPVHTVDPAWLYEIVGRPASD